MRIRSVLALMVAGLLLACGVASAQSTTTEPLSDYTTTTPTTLQAPPSSTEQSAPGQSAPGKPAPAESGVLPATAEGDNGDVAPSVAAQSAGSAPSELAFTGAEPLLLIALGLAVAAGATTLLVRDRRRIGRR